MKGGAAPVAWIDAAELKRLQDGSKHGYATVYRSDEAAGLNTLDAGNAEPLYAAPAAPPAIDLEKVEEALSDLIDRAHDFGTFSIDNDEVDPLNEWDDKVVPALVAARSVLSDIRKLREGAETQKAGDAP